MASTGAQRIIDRIRSLPRYDPLYVPDDQPWDDIFAAMKQHDGGYFIKFEDVVAAIIPSIGDVTVDDLRAFGKFAMKAVVASRVEIDYTATQQDLQAILVMLNQKVLANFEKQRAEFFAKGGKA